MFEDYKRYLTTIRNNLIQCGVEYPISPLETYRDLFQEGLKLDEVLWYYSLLAISGSDSAMSGFILPLNGYYKERMRQIYYKEFLDFLEDYKKLSTTYHLLEGYTGSEELKSSYSETLDDDEVVDLFSEETTEEYIENSREEISSEETLVTSNYPEETFKEGDEKFNSPVDFLSLINSSYSPASIDYSDLDNTTSHGVYLDELEYTEESNGYSDIEEYVPHGVYLDELKGGDLNIESQDDYEGYDGDEDLEESDFENHYSGSETVYEEDDEEEFDESEFRNPYSDEDEEDYEDYEDDDDYDESEFRNPYSDEEDYEDDEEEFDESEFRNPYSDSEEGDYEEDYEDDDEDLDEAEFRNPYSDSEEGDYEEDYEDDDEEEFNESEFRNPYSDEEDYEDYEDDDEDLDESEFRNPYSDDEEEDDLELQSWNSNNNPQSQDVGIDNSKRVSKPKKPTKDVSDYLQSATNSLLTAGKRFIYKETKKLKD